MILSIVTGTFNRLSHLQRMMASVRKQMPRHLAYEFVVVDGGSTDGTLDWLVGQQDVHLIRHGELRGAIKAFCDGAKMAQGDYVVMANDDVEFHLFSLLKAIAYLEDHPQTGAVAFADNRLAQINRGFDEHRVLEMPATDVDGTRRSVNYAQVGMFRRWLGDMVGWWGADDPLMSQARTYGGDNYLSSRIWELGYSVDAVEGCLIDDIIARDELRQYNNTIHPDDSAIYYTRFPRGSRLQPSPTVPNPQQERMRILVLPIYEPSFPAARNLEYGLSEALAAVGLSWEIDYVNEEFDLGKAVAMWQPDLLLTQIQGAGEIKAETLERARAAKPDMVIVNWNGDAHLSGLVSEDVVQILQHVDLQTVVNAKVLPQYEEIGIRAAYWQIGFKDPARPVPETAAHEVLFLGNCYIEERHELVNTLRETGREVGIYGSCPESNGNTHYDFAAGRGLYERCTIAISDTFPGSEAFVSNRLFQALASGAFVLQQHSPRLDEFNGLVADKHYVEWHSLEELRNAIEEWMQPKKAKQRAKIAEAGREYVRAHFNYDAQIEKLWELLP